MIDKLCISLAPPTTTLTLTLTLTLTTRPTRPLQPSSGGLLAGAICCSTALGSVGDQLMCCVLTALHYQLGLQSSYLYKEIRSEEAGNMTCRPANDSGGNLPAGVFKGRLVVSNPRLPAVSRSLHGALWELNKQRGGAAGPS